VGSADIVEISQLIGQVDEIGFKEITDEVFSGVCLARERLERFQKKRDAFKMKKKWWTESKPFKKMCGKKKTWPRHIF